MITLTVRHVISFSEADSLERLLAAVTTLTNEVMKMSASFDDLVVRVTNIESAADAMIVVLNDVAARLREMQDAPTPEQVKALADRLTVQTQEIVDATLANTGS